MKIPAEALIILFPLAVLFVAWIIYYTDPYFDRFMERLFKTQKTPITSEESNG